MVRRAAVQLTAWSIGLWLILAAGASAALQITEFSKGITPNARPRSITVGPDRNLWFTEETAGQIGRITPRGKVTEFKIPTPGSSPDTIIKGPDGALWFSVYNQNLLGRITTSGQIREFPLPSPSSTPAELVVGPDGALWFTEFSGDRIGRITTGGRITEFSEGLSPGAEPLAITVGPDHNMWFTEPGIEKIGRITPAGVTTQFGGLTAASGPEDIVSGPDHNLWFVEHDGNRVGRVKLHPMVAVKEFQNGISPNSNPFRLTTASDGNLWFTEYLGQRLARVTTSGVVTEFPLKPGTYPMGITDAPGGTIWFTEGGRDRIARFTVPPPPAVPAQITFSWTFRGASTTFNSLFITGLQSAGRLKVRCVGGGCPRSKVLPGGRRVDLHPDFRGPLSPGALLTLTATVPGFTTKIFSIRVLDNRDPTLAVKCLPRGSRTPERCSSH